MNIFPVSSFSALEYDSPNQENDPCAIFTLNTRASEKQLSAKWKKRGKSGGGQFERFIHTKFEKKIFEVFRYVSYALQENIVEAKYSRWAEWTSHLKSGLSLSE